MTDFSHLHALELRLSNEKIRLVNAKSPSEVNHRQVFVDQIAREIVGERKFLNLPVVDAPILSDDDLLDALGEENYNNYHYCNDKL